ncbi:DNA-3-methyladenine glycosylase family protein [Alkalimarinus coralli]|uniref:DNA-3-methyladenine glycosylase family protein n=1 Tax=Alkalimarinus coralli TaxID=2935863 RepID=UPI00202AD21D|nr:DNA-3-methyladenine glycosylase 2 family protein [Alkalimarinus coralli]
MDAELINEGMNALAKIDRDVAEAYERLGAPAPRIRPKGFETFLSTIVSQQISTEAAQTILGRVKSILPDMSADALLTVADQDLRQAGLSFRKIEYAKGLAEAVYQGHFDVDGLEQMTDEEAITEITALRGFGRWSAEIYLMFSLNRRDIFPADDLALQVALGRLKQLTDKPTPKQARALIEHWAPWRSVGSLFLWHYYRGAPA